MLKTRKGVQKRTKITAKGKVKVQKAGKRHLLLNKSSKAKEEMLMEKFCQSVKKKEYGDSCHFLHKNRKNTYIYF